MGSTDNIDLELKELSEKHGFLLPDRGDFDKPPAPWRDSRPDYRNADLAYFKGKTMNHKAGSIELIVENLVKKWEMESSHFPDYRTWTTIDPEKYRVQANGSKEFNGKESSTIGNYNWLMSTASKELYESQEETFESSHKTFRGAFPDGFPWEVLKVFSGPPVVSFSWRHWAHFKGEYKGRVGDGELVEMHGFLVVTVDDQLRICKIEAFYNPDAFLAALEGKLPVSDINGGKPIFGSGCPIHKE